MTPEQLFQDAIARHRAGRPVEAAPLYLQYLTHDPDHFDSRHMLGLAYYQQNRPAEAFLLLHDLVRRHPRNPDLISHYGLVLHALGRLDEAIGWYRQGLAIAPQHPLLLSNLGYAQLTANHLAEALETVERALAINPQDANSLVNRSLALGRSGRSADALVSARTAARCVPNSPDAQFALGNMLVELKCFDEALVALQAAASLRPDHLDTLNNLGNLLVNLARYGEAVAVFDHAQALAPDHPRTLNNKGIAHEKNGQFDVALAHFARTIELDPSCADAYYNRGYIHLLRGDLIPGWADYEYRFFKVEPSPPPRGFAQPTWQGEPIGGRKLLLHAEQGVGDTIQFIRYLPMVAERGPRIILEVQQNLKRLFAQLPGVATLVGRGDALPDFELQGPLLSLPRVFGTTLATIPAATPYLGADPAGTARWRLRIQQTGKFTVALCWTGNPQHHNDRNRSMTLAMLTPLLALEQVQFVSVQTPISDADREELARRPNVVHLGDELTDFADTAALIAATDIVVSVDTSVAHLAGALGKPVMICIPKAPDWRWMLDRRDTPWYPGAQLFRQPAPGDWTSVVASLRETVAEFAARKAAGTLT